MKSLFTLLSLSLVGFFVHAQAPANDVCLNAITVQCGPPITGTSVGATDTDTPTTCGTYPDDLGVWYTFTGNGGEIIISTCGPLTGSTGSLAYMALFSGTDCSQLTCLGNAGDFPGGISCTYTSYTAMAYPTVNGETYYLFITANAANPATIQFDLRLTCSPITSIC